MTDNRKAGIALIAGSIGIMVTMAVHPTAGGPLTPQQIDHLALVSGIAHALALVSVVVLFIGACGLFRYLEFPDRLSFAAIVIYAFSCFAITIAAAVSGWIVPDIMKHMARDIGGNTRQWQIVIESIFQINQAFARISSVAACAAIVLWSSSALRNGGLARSTAIYGCVIAPLIIVGIAVGHLQLDVHGMAVVALGQVIWLVAAGWQLFTSSESRTAAGA